jgi:hypothetical protein
MARKTTFTQKNKFLTPGIVLLVIMCWFLAFNKTFEAIKVHYQLKDSSQLDHNNQDLSFNSNYTERKTQALSIILESYSVDKKHWNNDVWLTVSSLAASQKVAIDFTITGPHIEPDTNSIGIKQRFSFYGDYISLVKLLNVLEHTSKIGRISDVEIKTHSKDVQSSLPDKCKLEINLQGL